ncbi:transporter substrate-binding domain-containing protein [Duodenibacillus massiliensis]|uniref:transporter substrate-binding domain-containing protein n=1 Tax=Duodenibacillus massiliensis TaxID=1852381 RepID=UPI003AF70871
MGTEGVYPPFTYHDAAGKLTGADVEFGRKPAEKLGVKPVFAETPRCGFDEHRPCAA